MLAPFDGNASYEKELERYQLLVGDGSTPVHASPIEHQLTPDRFMNDQHGTGFDNPHLHGNTPGWVQARKLVPNEAVPG